jgi:hypothetical protein
MEVKTADNRALDTIARMWVRVDQPRDEAGE